MADGWQEFRELMPITEQWTYLDHAAVACAFFVHDRERNESLMTTRIGIDRRTGEESMSFR